MKDLNDLLLKTSRTFAATIPLLPQPLREEVTVAYLLFRIADTLEDSTRWTADRKIRALADYAAILQRAAIEEAVLAAKRWIRNPPLAHEGYLELLAEMPYVLRKWLSFADSQRERIAHHTLRTIQGMSSYLAREQTSRELQLNDLNDLRQYCYVVAGIVGEMLTDLFMIHYPDAEEFGPALREKSKFFGEGLQLVNILKDSALDAGEGRSFLPPSVDRREIFELARRDLSEAAQYIVLMQSGNPPVGVLKFLTLPLFLAWPTLDRVNARGSGAKLTRQQVIKFVLGVHEAFDSDHPSYDAKSLYDKYRSIYEEMQDNPQTFTHRILRVFSQFRVWAKLFFKSK